MHNNFEREAESLASLNHPGHPNIPGIYDFFQDASGNYLVMKYIEGSSLSGILRQQGGRLPWREAVQIALALCDALVYMHARQPDPVLHRDIKPDNILIDRAKRVWLVDFGLSKAQPTTTAAQGGTTIAGTPGYAPPEQWIAQTVPASDIYSLGATLHHLITGQLPRQHIPFAPIRRFDQSLPLKLEQLIAATVQDKPEDRPSSKEFKEQLEKLIRPRVGVRPFTWQDGTQSDMPDDLPALADQRWEEAKGYLYGGNWLRWFEHDLKRNDMAALVRNATQHKNQDIGLDTFLRALSPAFPAPKLQLKTTALDFGAVPWQTQSTQTLEIGNMGSGCLHGRITNIPSWLRVTPSEFATHKRQAIKLIIDGNSLSPRPQPYTATLTIDAGIGGKTSLPLAVIVPEPQLRLKPANLNLGSAYQGETLTGTFTVHNSGGSAFEGSIRCDAGWTSISPTTLRCEPGESKSVELKADTSQLRMGGHSGRVSVQAKAGAWEQTVQTKVSVRLPWLKTFWRRWAPTLDWAAVGMVVAIVFFIAMYANPLDLFYFFEDAQLIFFLYLGGWLGLSSNRQESKEGSIGQLLLPWLYNFRGATAGSLLVTLGAWLGYRARANTWLGFAPSIALAGLSGMVLWGIVKRPGHAQYHAWSGIFALVAFTLALVGMIYLAIQPS